MKSLYPLLFLCTFFAGGLRAQVEVINTFTNTVADPNNGFIAFPQAVGTIGVEDYTMDLSGFGSVAMDSVELTSLQLVLSLASNDAMGAAVTVVFRDRDTLVIDDRTFNLDQDGGIIWTLSYPDLTIPTSGFVQVFIDPNAAGNLGRMTTGTWFIPDNTPALVGSSPSNFDGLPADPTGDARNYAMQMEAVLRSLPVAYATLDLTPDKDRLRLDWTTNQELNNEGFVIERSTDGTSFEEIGFRAGRGTSDETINYSFSDGAVLHNVPYFYRLKQMDYDGGFAYSEVLTGTLAGNSTLALGNFSPNPATGLTGLPISLAEAGRVDLHLFTAEGRALRSVTQEAPRGSSRLEVSTDGLPAGTYLAVVRSGEETVRRRLVVR